MQTSKLIKIQPIEGYANIAPNKVYTFRKRVEPYEKINWKKSFISIIDEIVDGDDYTHINLDEDNPPVVTNPYVTDTTFSVDISGTATPFNKGILDEDKNGIVRANNHFWNMIGTFNIYLDGTLIESVNNPGELDCMLKRMRYSDGYNVLKEFSNFNKSFGERYNDKNEPKKDYQLTPDFSKVWKSKDDLIGGFTLTIELVIHSNYLERGLEIQNTLPLTGAGPYGLTITDYSPDDYKLKALDLYLWIDANKHVLPIGKPLTYLYNTWMYEKRSLASGGTDFNLQFNLKRNIKKIAFAFQRADASTSPYVSVDDFTTLLSLNGYTSSTNTLQNIQTYATYQGLPQVILTSYKIRYGRHALPYYNRVSTDLVSANTAVGAHEIYEKLIVSNQVADVSGYMFSLKDFYLQEIAGDDNTENFVEFEFKLKNALPAGINLLYFYQYETQCVNSHDMSGNVTQIIPTF